MSVHRGQTAAARSGRGDLRLSDVCCYGMPTIEDVADLLRLRYVLDRAIATLRGDGNREADEEPDAGGRVLVEGAGDDLETRARGEPG
jgi:hypothetical protein